jgi:S-DNA-T family DNA segregation ATPase FtsK/SpoIIIE
VTSPVRAPFVRLGWAPWLIVLTVAGLFRAVVGAVRHPWLAGGALALVLVLQALRERPATLAPFGLVAVGLVLVWRFTPEAFERYVAGPVRSRWRRCMVYKREWQPAMLVAGLDRGERLPRVRRVVSEPDRDLVYVRDRVNTVAEWQAATARLARVFGVRAVRVRQHPRHRDTIVLTARRHLTAREVVDEAVELPPLERPAGAFPRAPR